MLQVHKQQVALLRLPDSNKCSLFYAHKHLGPSISVIACTCTVPFFVMVGVENLFVRAAGFGSRATRTNRNASNGTT
jgi:hypothetical protein